jgi:hypothetical protein
MTNNDRWTRYTTALTQYAQRTGHARVPATHTETLHPDSPAEDRVKLGAWVAYVRQRYRAGLLTVQRAEELSSVPGWEWGPLRPGPSADHARNMRIRTLRAEGVSLQKIGDEFGLSRQRVHQIVRHLEPVQ